MAYKHPDEAPQKVSARRMRLWNALHDFCRLHGGTVVSVPGHREMRVETPKGSQLASKLYAAGYDPHHCCVTSRITAGRFETVDVIAITMPV